jgi:hypothetical protein
LQYVADFLAGYCRAEIRLTKDAQEYGAAEGWKLNYSDSSFGEDEIHIVPVPLLFEHDIHPVSIECFEFEGEKAFFKTAGNFPFDILAAIFYLITRYEEYLPHEKDEYGRYAHRNSLAYKEGFLHLPLINIWLKKFWEPRRREDAKEHKGFNVSDLQPATSNLEPQTFSLLPTYDIDIAWSYRHKGLVRNAGGWLKSVAGGEWKDAGRRLMVLAGRKQDPYDSYDWMDELHRKYETDPVYFFHVGKSRNRYDKNIHPQHPAMRQLVAGTASRYKTGLHPSWQSGDEPGKIREELAVLQEMAGVPVIRSRQHFIRFQMPGTFRQLVEAGIEHDYSMGYGSINGFRASVAAPFYWYDLEREEQTRLLLHPFCFMDANSCFEQKLTPGQALDELMHYYHAVKSAGGCMGMIWHNTFLGTDPLFAGWLDVYERFISLACPPRLPS